MSSLKVLSIELSKKRKKFKIHILKHFEYSIIRHRSDRILQKRFRLLEKIRNIKTKVAQNHMVIPLSERSYFRIKCGSNKVISTSSNIKKVKYTAVVAKTLT